MSSDDSRPSADVRGPAWLVRSAHVGGRLLVLAAVVWVLALLVGRLTLLVVAVLVAVLIAGVFAPVVQGAVRRGVPRWVASALVVALLLAVTAGVSALVGARVAEQVPQLREQLGSVSQDLSQRFGVELPGAGSGSSSLSGGVLSSATVLADVLVGFFLTLALAFLFLKGGADMWQWVLGKLGGRVRDDVDAAGRAAWGTVGAYVRGLTIVALFDATAIGVGLLLLGVPLALTLAVLQFVASYVPTIGAVVAGALAVVVAYVDGGFGVAAAVLLLVAVVQQLGNDVIEPYVMGRKLPINAAVVLLAVTAGGLLWGIAGALLFVPLTAAGSAAARELWVRRGSPPIAGA